MQGTIYLDVAHRIADQVKKPLLVLRRNITVMIQQPAWLFIHQDHLFFNKANGQLQRVVNGKSEISLTGPVEAGFNHQLLKLKSYVDGANYVVEQL